MAQLELDNMEYSSDVLAQAAYVSDSFLDTYTKLLLHLNNNVDDSEITPKTVTNNNVTFSDTIKKWDYSGYFNGTTAHLITPDSADWDFGAGDFIIEAWINLDSFSSDKTIVMQGDGAYGDRSLNFLLQYESSTKGKCRLAYTLDGSTGKSAWGAEETFNTGT